MATQGEGLGQRSGRRWRRLALLAIGVALVVAAGAYGAGRASRPYRLHGRMLEPPLPAVGFTLTARGGQRINLSDFRGRVVLLYFGYTHCPDVCPASVSEVGRVWKQLGDDAQHAQFIMITVDPERDTPEEMADYVGHFNPSFLGLSGAPEEIKAVADNYAVFYEYEDHGSQAGYLVSHTASLMLIDREGLWRAVYPFGTPAEEIAPDMRHLIEE